MEIDKTTLQDLSIFNSEEEYSIFQKLDFATTHRGKARLKYDLATPLATLEEILSVQETVRLFIQKTYWPVEISNGTIMVIENYYESNIDPIPNKPTSFSAYSYKLLHGPDFSLVKYSTGHFFDFIKGMQNLVHGFSGEVIPRPMQKLLDRTQALLKTPELEITRHFRSAAILPLPLMLGLGYFFRYKYKREMFELLEIYARLDAWHSMSVAFIKHKLVFPSITKTDKPFIEAEGLYHLLLASPVPYDITLNEQTNFLFLTGANMAGKSTFIKSVGTAVFLAHVGLGVPARNMRISMFDGILSNINVIDNIAKGESYFYNEVQRIKATITKINDGRNWLILIDELFKGTNVKDAMKCSSVVIEGLLKIKKSLFILSTHLYEIGEELKVHPNIRFNYFETTIEGEQLSFSYQLKKGISNDRLGYLILKKEGVVNLLENL